LFLSQDGAISWRLIDTYVSQFTWGNAGQNGVHENSVWVLDFADKSGRQVLYAIFRNRDSSQKISPIYLSFIQTTSTFRPLVPFSRALSFCCTSIETLI
jgi:hypothetical protein